MINILKLNSTKWVSDTEQAGFKNGRNALFANQRKAVGQWHKVKQFATQVLGFNSTLTVQVYCSRAIFEANLYEGGGTTAVAGTITTEQTGYYTLAFDLSGLGLGSSATKRHALRLEATPALSTTENFYSEPITILGYGEQLDFYNDARSFGIAYRGDDGLFNGYYWGDAQVLLLQNVNYHKLGNSTDKETANTLKGEEIILRTHNLTSHTYRFNALPEYLYEIIARAAAMPECYVNGLKVTLDSLSEPECYGGLCSFDLTVKEATSSDVYGADAWTDYNLPDYSFELWGQDDLIAADDEGVVLSTTY